MQRHLGFLAAFLLTTAVLGAVGYGVIKGLLYITAPSTKTVAQETEPPMLPEAVTEGGSRSPASLSAPVPYFPPQKSSAKDTTGGTETGGSSYEITTTQETHGFFSSEGGVTPYLVGPGSEQAPSSSPSAAAATTAQSSASSGNGTITQTYPVPPPGGSSYGGSTTSSTTTSSSSSSSSGSSSTPVTQTAHTPYPALVAGNGGVSGYVTTDGHTVSVSIGAPWNGVDVTTTDGHQLQLNTQGTGF